MYIYIYIENVTSELWQLNLSSRGLGALVSRPQGVGHVHPVDAVVHTYKDMHYTYTYMHIYIQYIYIYIYACVLADALL